MSRVILLAADKPLPLCDKQEERTVIARVDGEEFRITCPGGFCVSEHAYYRPAVDSLGYEIKPFQYELNMEAQQTDVNHFLSYLREHFSRGEEVELWNLWVGDDREDKPILYKGPLAQFDVDTAKQFLSPAAGDHKIGQCRMTITI